LMTPVSVFVRRVGCTALVSLCLTPIAQAAPAKQPAKTPAKAPATARNVRSKTPPVLPPAGGLSYRGASSSQAQLGAERRAAALEIELQQAHEKEAQSKQQLTQ